ncbi:g12898 [Coccomyxa viridis]|uniref:G12898 protein n=1 Tax=Coccomyxa viridis TaxID=1274662 RepID=A0ABP1GBG5_9CHLO
MVAIIANHGPVHHSHGLEEEPELGRYMEDGELTESVGSLLQGASTHDMDHLDLSYPGLVADDAWHDIPATYTGLDTTPPTQPASYSDDISITGAEPPAARGNLSAVMAMDSGDKHASSNEMQAGHMSLDAARALAQGNIRPMQLLEILANRSSEHEVNSAQRRASPLRQAWRPEQNSAPKSDADAAGLPDAGTGPSTISQNARNQETEQCSMSAAPNVDTEELPGSNGDAWAEDATAQYTALEQQLREAHLSEEINWDKLTATVMQQMEHQHM